MGLTYALRDIWLVARFDLKRAVRSWSALVLILLFVIAQVGGSWLFIKALASMEHQVAQQMGVASSSRPGLMIDELRQGEALPAFVASISGDEEGAKRLLEEPVLAIFTFWLGTGLLPFLTASAAADGIAGEIRNRAIRFELLRTGRAEFVLGRLLAQVFLAMIALIAALACTWVLGMTQMLGQSAGGLAWSLGVWGGKALLFSLPFLGLGFAASLASSSSIWARLLALVGTAGSWMVWGLSGLVSQASPLAPYTDAVGPLFPQTWLHGLWHADFDALLSGLVLIALMWCAFGLGYLRFHLRDV